MGTYTGLKFGLQNSSFHYWHRGWASLFGPEGSGTKPSCSGDWGVDNECMTQLPWEAVWHRSVAAVQVPGTLSTKSAPSSLMCALFGFCQYSASHLQCHLAWLESVRDSTWVGQAVAGPFRCSTGALPSAAPVTELRWFLLNSWDLCCEWGYELCQPFEGSECLVLNSKVVWVFYSWHGRYSSKTVM